MHEIDGIGEYQNGWNKTIKSFDFRFLNLRYHANARKKFAYSAHTYRSRNGYQTFGNIKRESIDSFKHLELATKVDCVANLSYMYIVTIPSGCTHEEVSFVFLDDFGKISILLEKDNHLEEKITHLFNEIFLFSSLKKNTTSQVLNILKTCTVIWGNFEWLQIMFSSRATVWFGLEAQFSKLIKSQWYPINALLRHCS